MRTQEAIRHYDTRQRARNARSARRSRGFAALLFCALIAILAGVTYLLGQHDARAATPMRLATGSYVGNGIDNSPITGIGFQPDLVFVKCACTEEAVVKTSTMGGDAAKPVTSNGGFQTNLLQALGPDGFTLGSSTLVNANGVPYYWTAFKAGDEFAVGTYAGNGADDRSITGVGFQPVWVTTFGDGDEAAFRPGTTAGDASYLFDSTTAVTDRIQAMEADGFEVGANANINESGTTFHYAAWAGGANVTQATYMGDGIDNHSISGAGLQPELLWVKADTTYVPLWRPESVQGDATLYWTPTGIQTNAVQAFHGDGFEVGSLNEVNRSAFLYHYLAIKDDPPPTATPTDTPPPTDTSTPTNTVAPTSTANATDT
ncbi:MAG: hypothetical protein WD939_07615, partial [Dehalococcoidia bacterium]